MTGGQTFECPVCGSHLGQEISYEQEKQHLKGSGAPEDDNILRRMYKDDPPVQCKHCQALSYRPKWGENRWELSD